MILARGPALWAGPGSLGVFEPEFEAVDLKARSDRVVDQPCIGRAAFRRRPLSGPHADMGAKRTRSFRPRVTVGPACTPMLIIRAPGRVARIAASAGRP